MSYKLKIKNLDYLQSCKQHKIETLENRRSLTDMLLLYDILNNRFDCIELIEKIQFNVPLRRTRHTPFLTVPSASTRYAKMSPLTRIPALYNNKFSSVDPFQSSRNQFKKEILNILSHTK